MAVVEYMQHKEGHLRIIPEYILDRGHWYNPADHTFVGWIEDNPDYYIPETLKILSKSDLIIRILGMHANNRFTNQTALSVDGEETVEYLSDGQVTAMVEDWYDKFVEKNTTP